MGDVASKSRATAQELGRAALDDALIGQHRAGEHVDSDEARADRDGDAEGAETVVPQSVDAQGQRRRGLPNGPGAPGQRGDGLRRQVVLEERRVVEVLDHDGVEAGLREHPRVGSGGVGHGLEITGEARSAGQGGQVHHADEIGPRGGEGEGERGSWGLHGIGAAAEEAPPPG
jgi:hypothetical protein